MCVSCRLRDISLGSTIIAQYEARELLDSCQDRYRKVILMCATAKLMVEKNEPRSALETLDTARGILFEMGVLPQSWLARRLEAIAQSAQQMPQQP